ARQSRWYCRNRWESRSVPFFTRKPLLETVKGFFRLDTFLEKHLACSRTPVSRFFVYCCKYYLLAI
ncbi:hypothetical protein ACR79E_24180, partial [Sphingobacterium siyangense]